MDEFFTLLGGYLSYQEVVSLDEDEHYEALINNTNMVYRVVTLDK